MRSTSRSNSPYRPRSRVAPGRTPRGEVNVQPGGRELHGGGEQDIDDGLPAPGSGRGCSQQAPCSHRRLYRRAFRPSTFAVPIDEPHAGNSLINGRAGALASASPVRSTIPSRECASLKWPHLGGSTVGPNGLVILQSRDGSVLRGTAMATGLLKSHFDEGDRQVTLSFVLDYPHASGGSSDRDPWQGS